MTGNFLEATKHITSFQAPYCRDSRHGASQRIHYNPVHLHSCLKRREWHLPYIPFSAVANNSFGVAEQFGYL